LLIFYQFLQHVDVCTVNSSTHAEHNKTTRSKNPINFARHRMSPLQDHCDLASRSSRHCTLLQPVNVELALREQPRSAHLCESVEIAERGEHQAALVTVDCNVMRKAVGFSRGTLVRQPY